MVRQFPRYQSYKYQSQKSVYLIRDASHPAQRHPVATLNPAPKTRQTDDQNSLIPKEKGNLRRTNLLAFSNEPALQCAINRTLIVRWERPHYIMLVAHTISLSHNGAVMVREQRVAMAHGVAGPLKKFRDCDRVVQT